MRKPPICLEMSCLIVRLILSSESAEVQVGETLQLRRAVQFLLAFMPLDIGTSEFNKFV